MSTTKVATDLGQVVHETTSQPDTRREMRHDTRAVVQIYWQDDAQLPCEAVAVIRNISARGFGVTTDRSFTVGQSITVRAAERSMQCEVRHVQERRCSFTVGLEIRSSSDGSSLERSLRSLASAVDAPVPDSDQPA